MELKIAGGVGEHGRNCFYVDAGEDTFLVDCGKMGGSDNPFPKLERSDIRRVKYVFLTHSHADHTGALPWLFKNGFDGTIIASSQTLEQLTFPLNNTVPLEKICTDNHGKIGGITFEYGRAGHCAGSVWYHFFVDNKSILFSGDYTENSAVYQCDKIRERKADIAVIDCAYGNDETGFEEHCAEILSSVRRLREQFGTLFFPVPKYGRGLDLLKLLSENYPDAVYCGDEHFAAQLLCARSDRYWYKNVTISALDYKNGQQCDIMFISDPQLRSEKSHALVQEIISSGGHGVMTGTVENGSFSEKLIGAGIMDLLRYPVHQNVKEYKALVDKNDFRKTIPYHTAEFSDPISS